MIPFLTLMIQQTKMRMDARGASAVEYGLLVAGIAALIVVAVFTLGPLVDGAFDTVNTEIENGGGAGEGGGA